MQYCGLTCFVQIVCQDVTQCCIMNYWLELILVFAGSASFAFMPHLVMQLLVTANLAFHRRGYECVVHHHISIAVLPSNEVIIACVAQVHLWLFNLLVLRRSRILACTHSHQADYVSCEVRNFWHAAVKSYWGFSFDVQLHNAAGNSHQGEQQSHGSHVCRLPHQHHQLAHLVTTHHT